MSTSRNSRRGDIPSYYTSTTDDHEALDDGYLARMSSHSTASADLPLPPSRSRSKPNSTYSTGSVSSASGSDIHEHAVRLTAAHGRRASPPSQFLLSRPPTSHSSLAPHQPIVFAASPTPPDDRSLAPSPPHSAFAPPHLRSHSTHRGDSSSTVSSSAGSPRELQHARAIPSQLDPIEPESNRLSHASARSARTHLAAALAALPWAEPPPRAISPSSSNNSGLPYPPPPLNPGFSVPTSVCGSNASVSSPAYAFLQDDPVPSPAMLGNGRPASRASTASRGREGGLSGGGASRRSSVGSVHTPMAESKWMSPARGEERPFSGYSGMADVMSSSTHELSEESLMRSLSAAIRRLSRGPTVRSSKSSRSLGTTKTKRSSKSKRGSASTISHRYAGTRWSVDPEGQARLICETDKWTPEDVKQREADLDLLSLAGRAAVLERMLRAGKRVSSSTIRARGRASVQSFQNRLNPSRTSFRPSEPSRLSTNSKRGSRTGTPRTSASLRERLSRRLERHTSREDTFTELGDGSGDDEPVERLATPEQSGGVTVFPERMSLPPPPLPDKPRRDGLHCTDVVCLSPASHTPLFDYSQMEKAAPRQAESTAWVEQSPHLGHRSPNWRKRQSVVSYIATGEWDEKAKQRWLYAVLIGAGVVLILIVGLLAGLLSRRS